MKKSDAAVTATVLRNVVYVATWIALSGTVILYNKWILSIYNFHYPISLTMWHMFFSSALATLIIRGGMVDPIDMPWPIYFRTVVPIGVLFSGTLWLGNAAYMYLSVSFIQMLKALMPVAVFCAGNIFGTEKFSLQTLANMVVVTIGVAIASYGELNFVLFGVILQLLSLCTESIRLVLVQLLLQSRGLKLNPITSLYYIGPVSFVCLSLPWALLEMGPLMADKTVNLNPFIFISNAAAAFGLNLSVFLLIGKTSALTMNVAGVIKDWMLIGLSVLIFGAQVSRLNLGGYLIAFGGVCFYNYRGLQAIKAKQAAAAAQQADAERAAAKEGMETTPLMEASPASSKHSPLNGKGSGTPVKSISDMAKSLITPGKAVNERP